MKKSKALLTVILCCVFTSQAQVSGTVTGNGAGISGARVCFKNNPYRVTYTDATGAFSLSVPVIALKHGTVAALPSINNNRLLFATAKKIDNGRVDLFSLSGSRLFSKELKNVAPGSHNIPLDRTAQGAYIVQFITGEDRFIMKLAAGMGSVVSGRHGITSSYPFAKNAGSGAFADTLIVTAPTWKHTLVGLADYNEQVTVTLTASNPWKPTGALVKEKGMVKIMGKGHDFEMGQPDPNIDGEEFTKYELPVHTVEFTYDFWMDTTEVTQHQYDTVMKSGYTDYVTLLSWDDRWGVGDRYPAYYLYWGNAVLYCNARSKLEGLDTVYSYSDPSAPSGELVEFSTVSSDLSKNGYRLPTEAEWEYACRAGTATDYYWGKNYGPYPATPADTAEVKEYAVWQANSWDLGEGTAGYGNHQVAVTKPNAYGLFDMAGNTTEHCHDYWSDNYGFGTVIDPSGPATSDFGHILRGGNWGLGADALRATNRNGNFNPPNYPFFHVGFRTVKPVR
jgi:formylglycine-generating enzyme required for sulfatase activity